MSAAAKPMLLYYVGTLFCLSLVQAIFFTDSTENDYPRIGKRVQPLPKYMYKRWLGLLNNANDYDLGLGDSEFYGKPRPLGRLSEGNKQIDLVETDLPLTREELQKRRAFMKKIWLYLAQTSEVV